MIKSKVTAMILAFVMLGCASPKGAETESVTIQDLISQLTQEDMQAKARVHQELADRGKAVVDELQELLPETDANTQASLWIILSQIGSSYPELVPGFLKQIHSKQDPIIAALYVDIVQDILLPGGSKYYYSFDAHSGDLEFEEMMEFKAFLVAEYEERFMDSKENQEILKQRLDLWENCQKKEDKWNRVQMSINAEGWDEIRKDLYTMINEMGGILKSDGQLVPIKTAREHHIGFMCAPREINGTTVPGVLVITPSIFNKDSGFHTLYLMTPDGKVARAGFDLKSFYHTGGVVYTLGEDDPFGIPSLLLSLKAKTKAAYQQLEIGPDPNSNAYFHIRTPVAWTEHHKSEANDEIFEKPLLKKKHGKWFRLN